MLVFLSDGAPWISHWIADHFDGAVSILDYYHAVEYLHEFAKSHFKDEALRTAWTKTQQELLLSSQLQNVIDNIEKLAARPQATHKIIQYYQSNRDRMDYKSCQQIGIGIIGSGAIESAHRTVIQQPNEAFRAKVENTGGSAYAKSKGSQHEWAMEEGNSNGENRV